jgi:hypothetical protein
MIWQVELWDTPEEPLDVLEPGTGQINFEVQEYRDLSGDCGDLADELEEVWKQTVEDNPGLTNGDVPYLKTKEQDGESRNFTVEFGPFSHTRAFNRNPDYNSSWNDIERCDMLHISTHGHLLTEDGYLLFAVKTNQDDQISGFSGFPRYNQDDEIVVQDGEKSFMDIEKVLRNRMRPEIGNELTERIDDLSYTGITYVDNENLRGTDADYIVKVEAGKEEAQEIFDPHEQFEGDLYAVEFSDEGLADFIREKYDEGYETSPYAVGAMINEVRAVRDESAEQIIEAASETGIEIEENQHIDYLN